MNIADEEDLSIILDSDAREMDFSVPQAFELEQPITVHSLTEDNLQAIIRIDQKITGRARTGYLTQKVSEALHQSGIRVSLVAENNEGFVVGFIMARVDYGEFGRTNSTAIIDTIGVDPACKGMHIGQTLIKQLFANLNALQVQEVRTEVAWDDFALNHFLQQNGFRPAQQLVLHCPL